jgi:hypothetical protein
MSTRCKSNEDELFESETHFDEPGFRVELDSLMKVLERAKRPMNQREIKDAMSVYSGRYNIFDLLEFAEVEEVGCAPIKFILITRKPVRVYTSKEKRNYWVSGRATVPIPNGY